MHLSYSFDCFQTNDTNVMTTDHSVSFDSPAHYQIVVKGKINGDLLDLLGAHEKQQEIYGGKIKTTISIYVKDQAQLSGILNTLYDLQHTILGLDCSHAD